MNLRGQIDQLVSSVVVMILLVVLMGAFVIISSNFGAVFSAFFTGSSEGSSEWAFNSQTVDSLALGDLFLSENVVVNGKNVRVLEAMNNFLKSVQFDDLPLAEREAMIVPLENLFAEKYSCSGKNELYLVQDRTGGRYLHLDYPTWRYSVAQNGVGLPRVILQDGDKRDSMLYGLFLKTDLKQTDGYAVVPLGSAGEMYVKEVVKC